MIPEAAVAMLACARIGAAHSVVFGGFSRAVVVRPDQRCRREGARHCGRRLPAGRGLPAEGIGGRGARRHAEHRARGRRAARWQRRVDDRGARPLVPRPDGRRGPAHCPAEPMDSEQLLFLLYTSCTTGKPKGIMHTTGGYLTQVAFTHKYVFDLHPETDVYWCTADVGWVTGHSYIVYSAARQRLDAGDVRGGAVLSRATTACGRSSRSTASRFLHVADCDQNLHEAGRGEPRSTICRAAGARQRRRADQSGGVEVVPQGDRCEALPDRGHMVADRDGRHHDQPHARRDAYQAGIRHLPDAGHHLPKSSTQRGSGGAARGIPQLTRPWPGMARHLARPRPVPRKTGAVPRGTSPVTPPAATMTATTGCWAAWTT